jgi:hypothetical protein
MTIDANWLGDVVELMTGRAFDLDAARALAPVLGEPAEVLPWLVLRQGVLADEPAIAAALDAQAAQIGRPLTRRAPGNAVSAPLVEIDRGLSDALRLLIAEDVARTDLAEEVLGLFVRRHALAAADLNGAFRYRIGSAADAV